jgi:hypothetical protein
MFSKVLVGVDGRPGGRDAIALAKQLMEPGAHITALEGALPSEYEAKRRQWRDAVRADG